MLTIARTAQLDFGYVIEGTDKFEPALCLRPFGQDFEGYLCAHQAARYHLEIVSDDFVSTRCYVFEVAWDGKWSDNLDEMQRHLTITELKGTDE